MRNELVAGLIGTALGGAIGFATTQAQIVASRQDAQSMMRLSTYESIISDFGDATQIANATERGTDMTYWYQLNNHKARLKVVGATEVHKALEAMYQDASPQKFKSNWGAFATVYNKRIQELTAAMNESLGTSD